MNQVWITTLGRSGSGYLDKMLNATGYFVPGFKEWFVRTNPADKIDWFKRHPFNKILPVQMYQQRLDRHPRKYFEKLLGGIKYIHLYRQDEVARIVSLFIAIETKLFHVEEGTRNKLKIVPPFNKVKILNLWDSQRLHYVFWPNFLKGANFLPICYEGMIKDPRSAIESILTYLELPVTQEVLDKAINITSIPMTRPINQLYIKRLQKFLELRRQRRKKIQKR